MQHMSDPRPLVGFCTPYNLDRQWRPLIRRLITLVETAAPPRRIAVGDVPGADVFIREQATNPYTLPLQRRAAVARAQLVDAVQRSGFGAALIACVHGRCPPSVRPSPVSHRCFMGAGTSPWGMIAYAVGCQVPVFVFWCSDTPIQLPRFWGGHWNPARKRGVWSVAWQFVPAPIQPVTTTQTMLWNNSSPSLR